MSSGSGETESILWFSDTVEEEPAVSAPTTSATPPNAVPPKPKPLISGPRRPSGRPQSYTSRRLGIPHDLHARLAAALPAGVATAVIFPPVACDFVQLKGPRGVVDAAEAQLRSLALNVKSEPAPSAATSASPASGPKERRVPVPFELIGPLVGSGGASIRVFQASFPGLLISIDRAQSVAVLSGPPVQVADGAAALQSRIANLRRHFGMGDEASTASVSRVLPVPASFFGALIGVGGSEFDALRAAHIDLVLHLDSEAEALELSGPASVVAAAELEISERLASLRRSSAAPVDVGGVERLELPVVRELFGPLIGTAGSCLRAMEATFPGLKLFLDQPSGTAQLSGPPGALCGCMAALRKRIAQLRAHFRLPEGPDQLVFLDVQMDVRTFGRLKDAGVLSTLEAPCEFRPRLNRLILTGPRWQVDKSEATLSTCS